MDRTPNTTDEFDDMWCLKCIYFFIVGNAIKYGILHFRQGTSDWITIVAVPSMFWGSQKYVVVRIKSPEEREYIAEFYLDK